MRIEKADYKMAKKGYRHTKIQKIVEEFVNMNTPCAKLKLDNGEYASAYSASSAVKNYIKRHRCENLSVIVSGGEAYILNTLLIEDM